MKHKKILANKVYSDATLKGWKKEDLIEQIRILEHNWASAEESLNIQAKNCEMLLKQAEKDTAREIFTDIDNAFSLYYPHGQISYSVLQDVIKQLAKKKGVEVE